MVLGPLERRVMSTLWSVEATRNAQSVREALAESGKEHAYTTVAPVLNILFAKGVVDRQRQGRAWEYWATGTCSDLAAAMMHEAYGTSRHRERTINCFVSSLSSSDADVLREALQRQSNGDNQTS